MTLLGVSNFGNQRPKDDSENPWEYVHRKIIQISLHKTLPRKTHSKAYNLDNRSLDSIEQKKRLSFSSEITIFLLWYEKLVIQIFSVKNG